MRTLWLFLFASSMTVSVVLRIFSLLYMVEFFYSAATEGGYERALLYTVAALVFSQEMEELGDWAKTKAGVK